MSITIPPGNNKILDMAWKAHKAAQRAESRACKAKEKQEVAAPAAKKPAAKKPAKKGGRK